MPAPRRRRADPAERTLRLRRRAHASRGAFAPQLAYAIGAAALFSGASHAQPPPSAPGPGRPRATTEPVVVEAVRPANLPEDPSSLATLIDMEELRGEAKSVSEIIGDTVGVQVRRFGGAGDPVEISIRGSAPNQVVVLLNGVRLNTAQSGAVDLSTIPADLIERIEIVRGGGSVSLGSDAIGGVINLVTRRPSATPRTSAAFEGGSFSSYLGSINQSFAWKQTEFALGYVGSHSDGDWEFQEADRVLGPTVIGGRGTFERVNNESEAHSGLLTIGRDLGEWGRLRLTDSVSFESNGRPGPDAAGSGELSGQSLSAHQRRTRNLTDLLLEVGELPSTRLSGEWRTFYRYDRNRFKDRTPPLGAPIDSDDRNHSLGTRLRVERPFALWRSENLASLGTEYRHDWLHSRQVGERNRDTVGVFLQNETRLFSERLLLVPALRMDYSEGFDVEWIPRIGVVARLLPWLQIKGNVERSYRVPNFDELYFDEGSVRGNPSLKPEDAFIADLGFELGLAKLGPLSDLRLEFAVFRNDIDESIVFQPISNFVIGATNTGDALVRGLELAAGLRLFSWLGLSGNWTHLDSEVRDSGDPLPGRAEDEWLLRVELSPPSRIFKLAAERNATSSIPVSTSGGTRISARAVYNLSASLDLVPLLDRLPGESLQLSFIANNLGDVSVRDAQFFPQPGRSFLFRVEWKR